MRPITVAGRHLALRELAPADEAPVLELLAACEDYLVSATGLPAAPGDVQSLYYGLPDGAAEDDKVPLVAVEGERVIALIGAVRRYPGPADCSVGLFLVAPAARRQGIGTAVAAALLDEARAAQAERVTASTPAGREPGAAFLRARGFTLTEPAAPGATVGNRSAGPRERPAIRAILALS
jgi:GNAT superfamily N-acetyltransferase